MLRRRYKRSVPFLLGTLLVFCVLVLLAVHSTVSGTSVGSKGESVEAVVLFLLDESGGVSGLCCGAKPEKVYVVKEGKDRYDLITFILTTMAALYSNGDSKGPLIGVAKFADKYEQVFDFFPASELFVEALKLKDYEKRLREASKLDPCRTDYAMALNEAKYALDEAAGRFSDSGVQKVRKVLVLITDGSFRGSELEAKDREVKHQEAQDRLEELVKKRLNDLEIHVLLLGERECFEKNDCGLDSLEHKLRRDDLQWWKHTFPSELANVSVVRREGNENAFRALLEDLKEFMPPHVDYGWLDSTNRRLKIKIYPQSVEICINAVISVEALRASLALKTDKIKKSIFGEFKPSHTARHLVYCNEQLEAGYSKDWFVEFHEFHMMALEGNYEVFLWWELDNKSPTIERLEVPSELPLNVDCDNLKVTVRLNIPPEIQNPKQPEKGWKQGDWYELVVKVTDEEGEPIVDEWREFITGDLLLTHTFNLCNIQMRPMSAKISASIEISNPVGISTLSSKSASLNLYLKPEFEGWDIVQGENGYITITIPIKYAQYAPDGFKPFIKFEGKKPDAQNCPKDGPYFLKDDEPGTQNLKSTQNLKIFIKQENDRTVYQLVLIPTESRRTGIIDCYQKVCLSDEGPRRFFDCEETIMELPSSEEDSRSGVCPQWPLAALLSPLILRRLFTLKRSGEM